MNARTHGQQRSSSAAAQQRSSSSSSSSAAQHFTVRTQRTEVLEVRSVTLHSLDDPAERSQLQHALEPEHDLENPTIETVKAVAEIYKRRMARRIEIEFKTSMITTYDWQTTVDEYPKGQYSQFMLQITATIIVHQSGSHEFTHRSPESWDIK